VQRGSCSPVCTTQAVANFQAHGAILEALGTDRCSVVTHLLQVLKEEGKRADYLETLLAAEISVPTFFFFFITIQPRVE